MKRKNKLYYYGTDTEVRLGDKVNFKSLFLRKDRIATVCCIPKKTVRELMEAAADDPDQDIQDDRYQPEDWLIEMECGTITGWLYSPEDLQPNKRIQFLSRGEKGYKGISSDDLEELEHPLRSK